MNGQRKAVRPPVSGPDSPQSSGPPEPRPVQQSGSRGRVRHGNGASDQQREDQDTSSHTYEDVDGQKRYVKSAGATPIRQPEPYWQSRADAAAKILNPMYPSNAGTSPMQQPKSLRSRADAAAKMINPIYASGSADPPMDQPQTDHQARANDAENAPEVTYATIPDDAPMDQPQARANDDENTPDATIPDGAYPGGVSGCRGVCSFLRARRSWLAAGIAVLLSLCAVGLAPLTFSIKQSYQDDMRQLSTAVDALKLDLDNERNRSATLEQRLKDDMSTAVDALKLDLDNKRNRSATLEQRLHKIDKSLPCPESYTMWRGTCYKAFDTPKSFSDAAAACRADGGTLAMPRDAETNAFLISLYKSVDDCPFWFGLHDQREEGRFEWVDGTALGPYTSWGQGRPDNQGNQDCVVYSGLKNEKDKWNDEECHDMFRFICQAAPVFCPSWYIIWRGTCYKASNTVQTFNDAAAACRADGGTLAMPRDAETNAFLISLYKSVRDDCLFWFGLHDQAVEGRFEWVDGSALGPYTSWGQGRPDNQGNQDCVVYSGLKNEKDKWNDEECHKTFCFICQAAPVEMYEQAEPVRSPFSDPDSRQMSGPPPQPRPVPQSGSRGRVRHDNGASDKQREDQDTSSHTYKNAEEAKRYATSAEFADDLAPIVTHLFNASYEEGTVPIDWKSANVVPVPKFAGASKAQDMRPVSLLSVLAKLLERSILKRLLPSIQAVIKDQYAYVKGSSTTLALVRMVQTWLTAVDSNKPTLVRAIFADMSKAFDRVDHARLLQRVIDIHTSPRMQRWIVSYLQNRRQRVVIDGETSSWRTLTSGVPQGGVLSPYLFILFMSTRTTVHIDTMNVGYADDVTLSRTLSVALADQDKTVEDESSHLNSWAEDNKMTLNGGKSLLLQICFSRSVPIPPTITLGGQPVPSVDCAKGLGFLIDKDLTFNEQVNSMITNASRRLHYLRLLTKQGTSVTDLIQIYLALVRPVLEYGHVLLVGCSKEQELAIERVQRRALRIISLGGRRSVPDLPTLKSRREDAAVHLLQRMLQENHPLHDLVPPSRSAVSDLTLSDIEMDQMTLSWRASDDVRGYRLRYRHAGASYLDLSPAPAPGDTQATVRGLWADTEYNFTLTAFGEYDEQIGEISGTETTAEVIVNVDCYQDHMSVTFPRKALIGVDVDTLHLSDDTCRATYTETEVTIRTGLQECGTTQESSDDKLIFSNEAFGSPVVQDNGAVRGATFSKSFQCEFVSQFVISQEQNILFNIPPSRVQVVNAENQFTFEMHMFPSVDFTETYKSADYPVQVSPSDQVHFGLSVNSPLDNLELFALHCLATPSDDPEASPSVNIIQDGCDIDTTLQLNNARSGDMASYYSIQSFTFPNVDDPSLVYIHCTMVVCFKDDPDSRCSEGCIPATRRRRAVSDMSEARVRRASERDETVTISQGPLKVVRGEKQASAVPTVGIAVGTAAGIAGVLLMVAAVFLVSKRRGRDVKEQALFRICFDNYSFELWGKGKAANATPKPE
ncbi:uncharacterized protein LOC144919908 [Branchiostoma floridae x Branchiostoma belcheri]